MAGEWNDGGLDWFELEDGEYINLEIESDDSIHSRVLPGLWLPVGELLSGDLAAVIAMANLGFASPEYQPFRSTLN